MPNNLWVIWFNCYYTARVLIIPKIIKVIMEHINCEYADMNFVYEMCTGNALATAAISKSQTSGLTGFHKISQ